METKPPSRRADFLSLIQPPVLLSAAAECLAGAFIAGFSVINYQPWALALAAALLFGAGLAHSAYFDRHADEERAPERPLPAGRLEAEDVWRGGLAAVALAILLAFAVGRREGLTALGLAAVVLLHASYAKGVWGFGFLTAGLARGAALLLGLSADPHGIARHAPAALPILAYAVGWAVLRAGRQPGAPPTTTFIALLHLLGGVAILIYQVAARVYYRLDALIFLLPLLPLLLPRLVSAAGDPRRPAAVEAVQYGFVGLTLVDAALAAGYGGLLSGSVVATLGVGVFLALRRWPITLMTWPR